MSSARAAREPIGRLSRGRVLEAAIDLADAEGIEAVTMRRLADQLAAGAMSLYYHVGSKEAMLDGMVEQVVGEMELPPDDGAWRASLRHAAISAHQAMQRHPWSTALLLSGPRVSQARLRHMDAILGCLRAAGFSAEETDRAYHALDSHIMGFSLWLAGVAAGLERFGPVSSFLDRFDTGALPHLAEHVQQHLRERRPDEPGEFEFGLDLILDGLERIRGSA